MARKTVAQLSVEIQGFSDVLQGLVAEIQSLRNDLKNEKNDVHVLKNEIEKLKTENHELINERNKLINEHQELINENNKLTDELEAKVKLHNERNAGRKSIISDELIRDVFRLKGLNHTQKSIAEILGISVGLVNKILKNKI